VFVKFCKNVLALAQARNIDVILVTELTRWGRSMLDLFHTMALTTARVSVVRGRPPGRAGGNSGATSTQAVSERFVS
jgi:hypothetical protein